MKALIVLFLVLVTVGGLLVVYNPDRNDFRDHIHEAVEQRLSADLGTERIGRIVTMFGTDVAAAIAARNSERQDYILYSIYSIDLGTDGRPEDEWRFVGVAGDFYELSRPEILR